MCSKCFSDDALVESVQGQKCVFRLLLHILHPFCSEPIYRPLMIIAAVLCTVHQLAFGGTRSYREARQWCHAPGGLPRCSDGILKEPHLNNIHPMKADEDFTAVPIRSFLLCVYHTLLFLYFYFCRLYSQDHSVFWRSPIARPLFSIIVQSSLLPRRTSVVKLVVNFKGIKIFFFLF